MPEALPLFARPSDQLPLFVHSFKLEWGASQARDPGGAVHLQPFLSPESLHPLVVFNPAVSAEQGESVEFLHAISTAYVPNQVNLFTVLTNN